MGVLEINFLLLVMGSFLQMLFKSNRVRNIIYYCMCAQLLLLAVLKAPYYAVDSWAYGSWFRKWREMSLGHVFTYYGNIEPSYILLNKLIGFFTDDVQIFFGIVSSIVLCSVFVFIRKYSVLSGLSLVVFNTLGLFEFSYSILRQALATAIFLWGFKFVLERRFVPYCMVVLFAFSFHKTAALLIFVYFIYQLRLTRRRVLYSFYASIALFFAGPQLLTLLKFLARKNYALNYEAGLGMYIMLWLLIGIFYMIVRHRVSTGAMKLQYDCLNLAGVFQSLSLIMESFARALTYLQLSLIILVPDCLYHLGMKHERNKRFLPIILLAMYLVMYLFFKVTVIDPNRPYQFYWQ